MKRGDTLIIISNGCKTPGRYMGKYNGRHRVKAFNGQMFSSRNFSEDNMIHNLGKTYGKEAFLYMAYGDFISPRNYAF